MKYFLKKNKVVILLSLVILICFFFMVDTQSMKIPSGENLIAFISMAAVIVSIIYGLLKCGQRISVSDTATNKITKYFIIFFFISVFVYVLCSLFIIFFFK